MEYWKTITFATKNEMLNFMERHKKTHTMYQIKTYNQYNDEYALNYKIN